MPDVFGQIPELIEDEVRLGKARTKVDAARESGRNLYNFERALPQLQAGIAAKGQFYSSARRGEEAHADTTFKWGEQDIDTAMSRQLEDFERRKLYASIGLIV